MSIGDDSPTQVELGLTGIEIGIGAARVGVPHIHHGTGQRLAGGVLDLALHEQLNARVEAVIQSCFEVGQWRTRYIQRAFDGARGAAGFAGLLVFGVHQQVQVMLKPKASHQQPGFLARAQYVQVVHGFPELFRGHGKVFDDGYRVPQDTADQRFDPRVARIVVQAAGLVEKFLGAGSMGNLGVHGASSSCNY